MTSASRNTATEKRISEAFLPLAPKSPSHFVVCRCDLMEEFCGVREDLPKLRNCLDSESTELTLFLCQKISDDLMGRGWLGIETVMALARQEYEFRIGNALG